MQRSDSASKSAGSAPSTCGASLRCSTRAVMSASKGESWPQPSEPSSVRTRTKPRLVPRVNVSTLLTFSPVLAPALRSRASSGLKSYPGPRAGFSAAGRGASGVAASTWNQLVVVKDARGYHKFYQNGSLVHTDRESTWAPKVTPFRESGKEGEPLRLAMPHGGRGAAGRALAR